MTLGYWHPIQGLVTTRPDRIIVLTTEASNTMKSITPDELFRLHEELCSEALEVMRKKNQDYSQSTSGGRDVFKNFRGAEIFSVEPEVGLMIRINDKFQRVHSFIMAGELAVATEGVRDIAHDVINYAVLLYGLLEERKRNQISPIEIKGTVEEYSSERMIRVGLRREYDLSDTEIDHILSNLERNITSGE